MGKGIFRSTDTGGTWTSASDGIKDTLISSLAGSGCDVLAGTFSNGLFKSSDSGKTWFRLDSGMTDIAITGLIIDGHNIYANTDFNLICRSSDYGLTWASLLGNSIREVTGRGAINSFIMIDDRMVAAAGPIFVSTDHASTWTRIEPSVIGITSGPGGILNNDYEFMTKNKNCFFVASHQGALIRSYDRGVTREYISNDSITKVSCKECTGFTSIAANEHDLFAAAGNGIFRSSDDGTTWIHVDSSLNPISILAVDSIVFVSQSPYEGIFRSTDNGLNWVRSDSGFPYHTYTSHSMIMHTYPIVRRFLSWDRFLFAQTDSAVFMSEDNGDSWKSITSDLTDVVMSSMAVFQNDLFIGTVSWGILRKSLSDLGISTVSHEQHKPSKSSINTKNNGIELTLNTASDVIIKTFDMKGRLVSLKSLGELQCGSHFFSTRQILKGNGTFIVQILADGHRYYQKLLLIGR